MLSMRTESNVKAGQTFPPRPMVTNHNRVLARTLKAKSAVSFDISVCGCNHTQTLANRPKEMRLKEIDDALSKAAAIIERASRPTEELDPHISQLARASFRDRSNQHLWSYTARSFDLLHNNLENVIARFRQLAADLFQAQDIQMQLSVPPDLERINLTAEQCHHLILILEEALQNIAAHAYCSTVSIAFSIEGRRLEVKIHDNGSGLIGKLLCKPAILRRRGGGLRDVQVRVAELGWALEIASAPGWGTGLTLKLPLQG